MKPLPSRALTAGYAAALAVLVGDGLLAVWSIQAGAVWPAYLSLAAGTATAGALVGVGFWLLRRDLAARQRSQEKMERLQAELERRVQERTSQLEEVNQEMQAFTYSISHDLRAPVRNVQGLAQALLEDYGGRLDAEGRDYAERLVRSARRMEALIQDLLAYSRLTRLDLRLLPLRLDVVVADALTDFREELRQRGGELKVEAMPHEVVGHQTTLVQVVRNLLSNAGKFVAPGAVPHVRLWAEERDGRVRLWVEDDGIGVAREHQKRIFEVFERLHGEESYPGTGIGLAIVRKGAERMGGAAGVESEPGKGSRFWVDLRKPEAEA